MTWFLFLISLFPIRRSVICCFFFSECHEDTRMVINKNLALYHCIKVWFSGKKKKRPSITLITIIKMYYLLQFLDICEHKADSKRIKKKTYRIASFLNMYIRIMVREKWTHFVINIRTVDSIGIISILPFYSVYSINWTIFWFCRYAFPFIISISFTLVFSKSLHASM